MKTLVLHLEDKTTDFLKPIYAGIKDVTILNVAEKSAFALAKLIDSHDRLIFLGHGLPTGLIGYLTVFNSQLVISSIKMKKDNVIYIWCNADQYVRRHGLSGFSTGMFISEFGEALYCKIEDFDRDEIEFQNHEFARLVGKYIDLPTREIRDKVYEEFNIPNNMVAEYNRSRFYYFENGIIVAGVPPQQRFKRIIKEGKSIEIFD
jgi:hypothetical protein